MVVILVLGLLKWDRFAVVMRAATQQVRSLDYVAAAQATGASTPRIILGEILPNVLPHLIVVATRRGGAARSCSRRRSPFLGLGVQPPLPSWGLMIAEAKTYMFFSFWLIAIPGTALAVLVLAINMVGDGLRDVSAPDGTSVESPAPALLEVDEALGRYRDARAGRCTRCATSPSTSSAARRCASSANPAAASR